MLCEDEGGSKLHPHIASRPLPHLRTHLPPSSHGAWSRRYTPAGAARAGTPVMRMPALDGCAHFDLQLFAQSTKGFALTSKNEHGDGVVRDVHDRREGGRREGREAQRPLRRRVVAGKREGVGCGVREARRECQRVIGATHAPVSSHSQRRAGGLSRTGASPTSSPSEECGGREGDRHAFTSTSSTNTERAWTRRFATPGSDRCSTRSVYDGAWPRFHENSSRPRSHLKLKMGGHVVSTTRKREGASPLLACTWAGSRRRPPSSRRMPGQAPAALASGPQRAAQLHENREKSEPHLASHWKQRTRTVLALVVERDGAVEGQLDAVVHVAEEPRVVVLVGCRKKRSRFETHDERLKSRDEHGGRCEATPLTSPVPATHQSRGRPPLPSSRSAGAPR